MTTPITFWFDFTSPYAYFALDTVERLAHSHGRALIWRFVQATVAISTIRHRAARVFYALEELGDAHARAFGRDVFAAYFQSGVDISDVATLAEIAARHGMTR